MALRDYAGAAKRTTLVGDITAASTTFTVTDATSWPTGATGPFSIVFNLGAAGEEKVLVASRSGNTFTVAASGRGYDGTTASSALSGANVDHVLTATDLREANAHVNDQTGNPHSQYVSATAGVAFDSARLGGVVAADYSTTAQANAAYVAKADATTGVVDTQESTTSTTYVDLVTVGPTVTITTGTRALVLLSGDLQNTTASGATLMAFAISGATTRAVDENQRINIVSSTAGANYGLGTAFIVTGLTAGANTFTAKYRVGSGTGFYSRRRLVVIPL